MARRIRAPFDTAQQPLPLAPGASQYPWAADERSLYHRRRGRILRHQSQDEEHGLAIATRYRCLARALWRRPDLNAEATAITALIAGENKWRVQRYGIEGGLVDESERRLVPFGEVFGNLLSLIAEDIAHLGCEAEIEGAPRILGRGTSAIRQLAVYGEARQSGARRLDAAHQVVDWLIATTRSV